MDVNKSQVENYFSEIVVLLIITRQITGCQSKKSDDLA